MLRSKLRKQQRRLSRRVAAATVVTVIAALIAVASAAISDGISGMIATVEATEIAIALTAAAAWGEVAAWLEAAPGRSDLTIAATRIARRPAQLRLQQLAQAMMPATMVVGLLSARRSDETTLLTPAARLVIDSRDCAMIVQPATLPLAPLLLVRQTHLATVQLQCESGRVMIEGRATTASDGTTNRIALGTIVESTVKGSRGAIVMCVAAASVRESVLIVIVSAATVSHAEIVICVLIVWTPAIAVTTIVALASHITMVAVREAAGTVVHMATPVPERAMSTRRRRRRLLHGIRAWLDATLGKSCCRCSMQSSVL
jgi:hypothetical protein